MQQAPGAAARQLPPLPWPLLQLLDRNTNMQPKARTSDDCGHLLLQPCGCPRGYLGLLLSSLCLAVGLLLAPLQLRKHIHNDLQKPCRQCWSASHVDPAEQVGGTLICGEQQTQPEAAQDRPTHSQNTAAGRQAASASRALQWRPHCSSAWSGHFKGTTISSEQQPWPVCAQRAAPAMGSV